MQPTRGVRPVPLARLLRRAPQLLVLALPMLLLRAGRRVCLLAQRFPPAVWVVRRIAAELARRRPQEPPGLPH